MGGRNKPAGRMEDTREANENTGLAVLTDKDAIGAIGKAGEPSNKHQLQCSVPPGA